MKTLKKLTALILAVAMLCTLAACHPKDEVAISSGDYTITSAIYSYYLLMADNEAKTKIKEEQGDSNETPNFYEETIDGKPFEQYVRDVALDGCKTYLACQKMCDEAGIKLSAEQNANVETNAETYWYSYGYYTMLEPNGISLSTYTKILKNEARYGVYFEELYGKGGDKEVPADDINKYLSEHYAAVWMPVEYDYSSEENVEPQKLITQYETYKTMLEGGASFEEVVMKYKNDTAEGNSSTSSNNSTSSNSSTSSNTSSKDESSVNTSSTDSSNDASSENTSSSEEKEPKDKNITILTDNEDTLDATFSVNFSSVKSLENGKATVLHDAINKKIFVVMKKDFFADEYYTEQLDMEVRDALKGDEFDADLAKVKDALKLDVNDYAIKQFKIKKIVYPTQTA